ncbi:MAG: tRNA uridine-5-carboxymethylaminomethyl(34) synthesis GTPase MnmE [Armatimonadota bacterium]
MALQPVFQETIAAVATATGAAGVGIVRISGPDAFTVADRLTSGKRAAANQPTHTLRRVTICDPNTQEPLDDALLAVFHGPRSLTGENVVEIQGHGGMVTLQRVLSACLAGGARAARPGEFTERAFRNGKMDLAQAEAVAALVSSQTVAAQRAALRQVSGELSDAVNEAAVVLQEALALIEASIDFPEEIGDADPVQVDAPLAHAETMVRSLLSTAGYGRRLQEGLTIVLAGRPNVGKSSLLNALSGTQRAIVTPIPGTTRDIVEEALNLQGLPVRALDTAGIRDTFDPVEQIGVARAREAMRSADVVVAVLDAADGTLTAEDVLLLESLAPQPHVVAVNKSDAADPAELIESATAVTPDAAIVPVSATTQEGLSLLSEAIVRTVTGNAAGAGSDAPLVTSARHEAALRAALDALLAARATLAEGLPLEMIAVDVHGTLQSLGEITGAATREEIIAGIFARFCLGK